MSKFVLFDVGANWGFDSLDKTQLNPSMETWAFEPTPELINHLTSKSETFSDRYHISPIALSDFDGTAQFNIADTPGCDWGCSSLNNFSDNLDQTWPGRWDFKFNRTIDVKVSRFDTWYKENNIQLDRIDFFHCDTQGSDLKVLEGMGDLIHLISEGVIECAREESVKLYKENHTLADAQQFLISKGFVITNLTSNDVFNNEINLHFKKL
jgi:FkbM family methyltransferase